MTFDLIPAAQIHGESLSTIHTICFRAPWGINAFYSSLALPTTSGLIAQSVTRGPAGFVLWSVAAEQAEILTIAVLPPYRRTGLGRRLLVAAWDDAVARHCLEMFLDVAEDNIPAQALYTSLGFAEVARRRAYYPDGEDAILMKKTVVSV